MNLIYLLRHGENVANLTKEFSCRKIDYSLTPRGILQAQQSAAYFQTQSIDAIYASPLKRAVETAAIIADALSLSVTTLEGLREIGFGTLENAPDLTAAWNFHNNILQAWFEGDPEARFPQGENQHDLIQRMRSALHQAVDGRDGQRILVVGHGGIFRSTIEALCPTSDMSMVRGIPTQNCSFSRLDVTAVNGNLHADLLSWGEHQHLSGEAARFASGTPSDEELEILNAQRNKPSQ
jgi:broad specificity phosphatase PhoE